MYRVKGRPAVAPRRRYPTDLTDAQRAILEPFGPAAKPGGARRSTPCSFRYLVDRLL
ncbi:MAG: hypothetical protein U0031_17595 [Thermomicrobiales bacterium]